ncbi:uncharacterized protein (DUF1684 family) [Microbacterium terrae]|uniref:DUF1684 domain-containing protein n=1 Tax=Microbacterium terrae TaxID=69369 RepID=A0A0M2H5S0_9MICO|nr:DUF1684 domain-containing protein [Microbacterium terrae]KJL39354.1 hypothetical protein RS81_01984 [Microbacterium terrae]MBP1078358.1 uncharacterized protein (DUF1684 family) [Microbacterium terrae]GLJ97838.1 hypothetical protein GCM10017594_10350 [Microbacterium terrae]
MTTAPTSTVRWDAVSAPHGTAALRHTHWLDATPRAVDGAPGEWWAEDGRVHGRGLPETGTVDLEPFTGVREADLLLKAFARTGSLALRVYDPENPDRLALRGIEAYPRDDAWAIAGRFVAAEDGAQETILSVDGHERTVAATGSIELTVAGEPVHLTVSADGEGFSAVIADASAADGAYRFRFLPIAAPTVDGAVTVDFNDAYLPPCAFSDQYVCPLPPPENRLAAAVTAGEKRAIRD